MNSFIRLFFCSVQNRWRFVFGVRCFCMCALVLIRRMALAGLLLLLPLFLATAAQTKLQVTSTAFGADAAIPALYSCKGENINPPLEIKGVPSSAKSLVLIVDDPDAPGGLFTHWIVWNIAPSTSGVAQKGVPDSGIEGTNDFGKKGYGGPCPPSGTHRYFFRVLALDQKLDLHAGAKRAALNKAMNGHIVAQGELVGRFGQ